MAIETSTQQAVPGHHFGPVIRRIAVGISGFPEGDDAAVLASALAAPTGADLMLISVHPAPLVVLPPGLDWKSMRADAETHLRQARDSVAPAARTVIETDHSVPRALHRLVHSHHQDVLVLGSSRRAPNGRVRIGKRTRQLIGEAECALAVAPRGLRERRSWGLHRIVVGYDGGVESKAALALAGSIADAADAELQVCAVVDDRVPLLLRSPLDRLLTRSLWREAVAEYIAELGQDAHAAARLLGSRAQVEIQSGRPAGVLLELGRQADLLVVGSRRWGALSRLLLGSTGESLLHDAECPVMVVPRPGA